MYNHAQNRRSLAKQYGSHTVIIKIQNFNYYISTNPSGHSASNRRHKEVILTSRRQNDFFSASIRRRVPTGNTVLVFTECNFQNVLMTLHAFMLFIFNFYQNRQLRLQGFFPLWGLTQREKEPYTFFLCCFVGPKRG